MISGPSGVGKGTLFKKLFSAHEDCFALSVSHTTRQPRAGEAHGVDYYYVTADAFEALAQADGFVEHAKFGSNRYGTSKQTIADQSAKGRVVVLDIEMEVSFLFIFRSFFSFFFWLLCLYSTSFPLSQFQCPVWGI